MTSLATAGEPWCCLQTSERNIWQSGMESLLECRATPRTVSGFWIKISWQLLSCCIELSTRAFNCSVDNFWLWWRNWVCCDYKHHWIMIRFVFRSLQSEISSDWQRFHSSWNAINIYVLIIITPKMISTLSHIQKTPKSKTIFRVFAFVINDQL